MPVASPQMAHSEPVCGRSAPSHASQTGAFPKDNNGPPHTRQSVGNIVVIKSSIANRAALTGKAADCRNTLAQPRSVTTLPVKAGTARTAPPGGPPGSCPACLPCELSFRLSLKTHLTGTALQALGPRHFPQYMRSSHETQTLSWRQQSQRRNPSDAPPAFFLIKLAVQGHLSSLVKRTQRSPRFRRERCVCAFLFTFQLLGYASKPSACFGFSQR